MRITTAVFAAASTTAPAIVQSDGHHLAGLQPQAGWAAGDIALWGSADGIAAAVPLQDKDGAAIVVKVAVGKITSLPADLALGASTLVLVSSVTQTAGANVTMIFRQYS